MMIPEPGSKKKRIKYGSLLKLMIVASILAGMLLAILVFDISQGLLDIMSWIEAAGPKAPLVFFGLYVLAGIFMFPGMVLTLGAGVLFGVFKGSLIVYCSATASATAAFLVGRYLARDMVSRRTAGNRTFQVLDRAVAAEGWKIVLLTRLSPIFPYNVLNYAYGLTRVSLRDYVLASLFGMMPYSTAYVYLGSLAGNLAEVGTGGTESRSALEWGVYLVGLIATLAMAVVITRIAQKALRQRIETPDGEDPEE